MGRGYHNVRAIGGAVKPLPWRGLRGLGRRLKPLLMKKGLGLMEEPRVYPRKPCMGNPCKKVIGFYPIMLALMVSTIYLTSSSVTYGPAGKHMPILKIASDTPLTYAGTSL